MVQMGTRDLAWLFAKCGSLCMGGFAPWLNICKGWVSTEVQAHPQPTCELGRVAGPTIVGPAS